jgi:N utilization substance protein B
MQGEKVIDLVNDFIGDCDDGLDVIVAARELTAAVFAARAELDEILTRHATRWELHRLALVDRNILRLGAYELRAQAVPFKVAIDEAIMLAHEFSTADSPRFVNGVLDAVAKELRAGSG